MKWNDTEKGWEGLKHLFVTSAWTSSFQQKTFFAKFTVFTIVKWKLCNFALPHREFAIPRSSHITGRTPWQGDVQNSTGLADKVDRNGESKFSLSSPIFQPLLMAFGNVGPRSFPRLICYTELLIRSRQEAQKPSCCENAGTHCEKQCLPPLPQAILTAPSPWANVYLFFLNIY